jgi:hypothetical protein
MSDPFRRGSAPDRARGELQRPGSFKSGHKKMGGRKKGTPNAISADYVSAVLEAAYRVGRDGNGKDGLVGYLRWLFIKYPKVACILLSRLLALEDCGWPLGAPLPTMDEINQQVRDVIGSANKTRNAKCNHRLESAGATQWPVEDLIRIARKHPAMFGKILVPLLPQPTGRFRRAMFEAR